MSELIVRREGGLGRLTLNRPEALGALTLGMCETMIEALLAWRRDDGVKAVWIDHEGGRGFSAGGDIRTLADSAQDFLSGGDGAVSRAFFFTEYRLDHLINTYSKPVITVMDGVTMGGGVGISWTARYRIGTERTTFAMPETGIGLFPDVGAGYFLPRLRGQTGMWLGLTGSRLRAGDCERLGIVTDVLKSSDLAKFRAAMAADPDALDTLLTDYETDPGPNSLAAHEAETDALFAGNSVEAILENLRGAGTAWANEQLAALATKSPTSLKVAHRLITRGAEARSFAEDMVMEHRISARLALGRDFIEGVRAVIVDKDNAPRWDPPTLEGVTEAMLDEIFAPLPEGEGWTPLPELKEPL